MRGRSRKAEENITVRGRGHTAKWKYCREGRGCKAEENIAVRGHSREAEGNIAVSSFFVFSTDFVGNNHK